MANSRILVTGSAGQFGQALIQILRAADREVVAVDILDSPLTDYVGSCLEGGEDFRRALA